MKLQSISLILFLFSYASIVGQTITSNAIPNIGDQQNSVGYITGFGFDASNISVGSAGANQEWDFSNPDIEGAEPFFSSVTYVAIDDNFTYRSEFPNANMGVLTDDSESYFLRTNSDLKSLGFASPGLLNKTEGDCSGFSFPFSFNDTYIGTCTSNIYNEAIDTTISVSLTSIYRFDATGTVHTPEGTFRNCNRIVAENGEAPFRSYTYTWYAKNSLDMVARIIFTENTGIQSLTWGTDFVVSSLEESEATKYELDYLNNGQFLLTSEVLIKANIRLVDLMGRTISTLNNHSIYKGENQLEFAMNHLATGVYILMISDAKTGVTQSLKFMN